jgi:hypothetical protein
MRLCPVVLIACGSTSTHETPEASTPAPIIATCEGKWTLVELFPLQTTCSGLGRFREEIIVDIVDGRYRARHVTGGELAVTASSALGEPCALTLRESGYQPSIDTASEMEWQIGDATRGVYRDLEAWTQCAHEFRALAVRRDVAPADIVLDVEAARAAMLAWWDRFPRCRPLRPTKRDLMDPSRSTVDAEMVIDKSGRVERIRALGQAYAISCGVHSCECPEISNATGAAQTIALRLPLR